MSFITRKRPAPAPDIEAQIQRLNDEIERLQSDGEVSDTRRRDADAVVIRLTAEAAAGSLKDGQRLVDAIRHQRQLAESPDPRAQIPALQAQRAGLEQQVHEARRADAAARYNAAVMDYTAAYARLVPLAAEVRAAAAAAGVMLSPHNSPGLPAGGDRHIVIGGAVVHFPRGA